VWNADFSRGGGSLARADSTPEIISKGRFEASDVVFDSRDFLELASAIDTGKQASYEEGHSAGYDEGYSLGYTKGKADGGISTPSFTINGSLICNKYCYFGGSGDFYGNYFNTPAGEQSRATGYRFQFNQNTLNTYRYFLIQISGGQRSIPGGGQELFTDVFYYDAKKIPVNTTIQTCQEYYPTLRVYGIK
jgi:hypothetical protein